MLHERVAFFAAEDFAVTLNAAPEAVVPVYFDEVVFVAEVFASVSVLVAVSVLLTVLAEAAVFSDYHGYAL